MKSILHMQFIGPVSPKVFFPFHSTANHFQDTAHIKIFALTPVLNFESDTNLKFADCQEQ